MATFRILYTENPGENVGWWADVTADDAATAAWSQAVKSTVADPANPPQLVTLTQLSD